MMSKNDITDRFMWQGENIQFGVVRTLEIPVPLALPPTFPDSADVQALVSRYFDDPGRFLRVLWNKRYLEHLGGERWLVGLPRLKFLNVALPSPDIEVSVWKEGDFLRVTSHGVSFSREGGAASGRMESFNVEVDGYLDADVQSPEMAVFNAQIGFTCSSRLPSFLRFTPEDIMRTGASAVNRQILNFATRKLEKSLQKDFLMWLDQETQEPQEAVADGDVTHGEEKQAAPSLPLAPASLASTTYDDLPPRRADDVLVAEEGVAIPTFDRDGSSDAVPVMPMSDTVLAYERPLSGEQWADLSVPISSSVRRVRSRSRVNIANRAFQWSDSSPRSDAARRPDTLLGGDYGDDDSDADGISVVDVTIEEEETLAVYLRR